MTPILVGDKAVIDQVLAELGEHIPAEDIHDEPDLAEAAARRWPWCGRVRPTS